MSAHVRFVDPPTPTSPTSPSTSSSDQGSTIRSPDHKDLEAVRAIFDRISQAAAETKAAGEAFEQLGHTLQHLATHLTDQAGSVRPTTGSETNGAASGGDDVVEVVKGDERWEEMLDMCGEQVCWTRSWTGSCACDLQSGL